MYQDHLGDVAFSVDGHDVTLEDLSFYILYEEKQVEDQATIYNPDNTRDYWNTHIDGQWISVAAKTAVADMAIHDIIMYNLARDNYVVLSSEEKSKIRSKQEDFYEDLYDSQRERLLTDRENINDTIERIAIGQKYQAKLAEEENCNSFDYDYDGRKYEKMLKKHKVVYNDEVWDKVKLGNITLVHTKVHYINGLSKEEER